MSKHVEYVKTIDWLERLKLSTNGNPRFKIYFTDGSTATTQTDASVAYGLENRENIGVPVLVKATPAGRVWDVTPVERQCTCLASVRPRSACICKQA